MAGSSANPPRIANPPRMVVGISGASGSVYGLRLLELLRGSGVESHLVISRAGELTLRYETGLRRAEVEAMADYAYPAGHIGAAIASGSFRTLGMVVAPCSVRTLSEIASGTTGSLLTRAADVILKERRRLVLVLRETPLHLGHLRSMTAVTEMGAIVYPPVPAFYARPAGIDEMVTQTCARVLDLFDLPDLPARRWGEDAGPADVRPRPSGAAPAPGVAGGDTAPPEEEC